MAKGGQRPGAGRKAGSKNKLTREEKLAEKSKIEDLLRGRPLPVEVLFDLMSDKKKDDDIRLRAAVAAAPYVHKKQPMDVNNTVSFPTPRPVTFTHTAPPGLPDDVTASRN